MAPGSNFTDGHGKGFTDTATSAGTSPDPIALLRIVLRGQHVLYLKRSNKTLIANDL